MFQKLTIFLIFSFPVLVSARTPGTYSQLESDLKKVSQRNLITWVNELVSTSSPSRMVGLPGHEKARLYITDTIRKLDPAKTGKLRVTSVSPDIEKVKAFYQKTKSKAFTTFMQAFAERKKENKVENIIWEKNGINSEKVLVITAHYDTISHDKNSLLVQETEAMPGANYNASGVAVALGIIKTLSGMNLNYSVKVVFLDWHGIAYHGAEILADELKSSGKEIMGVVNLEMLGQDTTYFDKNKKKGNMAVYVRNKADEIKWTKGLIMHGEQMTSKVSFEVKPNGLESSDNVRFWEQNLLSATFSQNWEDDFNPKFYQTTQDTPETLNHETLWYAYQYVGGAVIGTLLDLTR